MMTTNTRLKPEFRSIKARAKQSWRALKLYRKDPAAAQQMMDEMYEQEGWQ